MGEESKVLGTDTAMAVELRRACVCKALSLYPLYPLNADASFLI